MMRFEPPQVSRMLAPLLVEEALSDIPIFGPDKADIAATIEAALKPASASSMRAEITNVLDAPLPDAFYNETTIAEKLRSIRGFVREQLEQSDKMNAMQSQLGDLSVLRDGQDEMALASDGTGSCREIHEALLSTMTEAAGLPRKALNIAHHAMLLRAKERYLFDAETNRNVVSDDPWTRFVWDWIGGKSSTEA